MSKSNSRRHIINLKSSNGEIRIKNMTRLIVANTTSNMNFKAKRATAR